MAVLHLGPEADTHTLAAGNLDHIGLILQAETDLQYWFGKLHANFNLFDWIGGIDKGPISTTRFEEIETVVTSI